LVIADVEKPRHGGEGSCVDYLGQASRGREGKEGVEKKYDVDALVVWEVMLEGTTNNK
jgi:hypothetical protein